VRIVIDTNIWISGLLWRGLPRQLLQLAETERVELCMTEAMLQELSEVLRYPRLQMRLQSVGVTPDELIDYVLQCAIFFETPSIPSFNAPLVAADPDDDIFIYCALVAEARYLVSGDHHLLEIQNYASISIVTVQDFFAQVLP
jgi:putative PIN family toxin of toxin-antitoxin system